MKNSIIRDGKQVLDTEILGIKKLYKIFDKNFSNVVEAISKTKGKVIVTGVGKSGHIANKISSTLSSTGTPSQFCTPTDMSHGDLGVINSKDTLIVISNSGNSMELKDLLDYSKNNSIKLIGISSNPNSDLIKWANMSLILPKSKEACSIGLAPTTSTTMALILGDAISVSLMKLKKFKLSDYKKLHPGGALGVSMLQIKDIMHKKNKIPIVNENESAKSVLIEITKKSLGHVGVTNSKNEIIGIITDGDLRRKINKSFLNLNAKEIMTAKPILIEQNKLMTEAMKIMNRRKITCLFVVDESNLKIPIGVVHIHDCLRYAS